MGRYDDLADLTERGALVPVPGSAVRGEAAARLGQDVLMSATGTTTLEDATRVALGRPRLGSDGPSPVWRVRATARLDAEVRAEADRRGITISQMVRDAVAAYLRAG